MIDTQAFQQAVNVAVTEALKNFALGTLAPKSEYLTVKQLCEELDISRAFADKLIREDGLPIVRMGANIRIRRVSLEQWLEGREEVSRY